MNINSYISIKEQRLLIIFAIIIFSLTIINLGLIGIDNLKQTGIDFCAYCPKSYIPIFRFFVLFFFPFVLWSRKFYLSIIFTSLSFLTFSYEVFLNFRANIENNFLFSMSELFTEIARPLDYLVFLLISVLLFWQISILLRILIQTTQRKPELP